MKNFKFLALLLSAVMLLGSCATTSNAGKGAGIGAGSGAALGAIVGGIFGGGKGALIGASVGAGVGAGTGAVIGRNMDKKAARAAEIEGAKVEKVTDSNGLAAVKVTFESGILFEFNSSTLSSGSKHALAKFSEILKEDRTVDIAIIGKTDKVGSYDANITVSNRRAQAVKGYLMQCGVDPIQFKHVEGVGYNQYDEALLPAQNRAVDVYMYASAEMIENANQAN